MAEACKICSGRLKRYRLEKDGIIMVNKVWSVLHFFDWVPAPTIPAIIP
jgi:hypothetical protein